MISQAKMAALDKQAQEKSAKQEEDKAAFESLSNKDKKHHLSEAKKIVEKDKKAGNSHNSPTHEQRPELTPAMRHAVREAMRGK